MKRSISFLAMAAALGLASVAHGQTSPGPQPNEQAAPAQQQAMPPANEPSSPPPEQQPMPRGSEPPAGEPPGSESSAAAPPASGDVATRLAAVVPSGMSPQEACAEFRSVEECATALHLAQNLKMPFKDLKSKLKSGEGVGAIIHEANPQADPKVEISRARDQARADLGASPQG